MRRKTNGDPTPVAVGREAPHEKDAREVKAFRERMEQRQAGLYEVPALKPLRKRKPPSTLHFVVIGDSHAHPDIPNHRYEWAGDFIAERRPDIVVDIGDSADMASLLFCDGPPVRKIDFERRRYFEDVEAYVDAKERLTRRIPKDTRLVKTDGNHEFRIERLCAWEPKLRGWVDATDLRDAALGWELVPFLQPIMIGGVAFCHYWKAPGSSDRPIAGVMPTRASILKLPGSFHRVQGHTHRFEWYEIPDGQGSRITSIMAGCYFDPDSSSHDWAGSDTHGWRPGLLELWTTKGTIIDFRWTSYESIQQRYG